VDVDLIAPPTPEIEAVARSRTNEIVKEWGRLLSVWGTSGTHGKDGEHVRETFTIEDLAIACYVQGVRDTTAVAASTSDPKEG
jgi:hypothetical protein